MCWLDEFNVSYMSGWWIIYKIVDNFPVDLPLKKISPSLLVTIHPQREAELYKSQVSPWWNIDGPIWCSSSEDNYNFCDFGRIGVSCLEASNPQHSSASSGSHIFLPLLQCSPSLEASDRDVPFKAEPSNFTLSQNFEQSWVSIVTAGRRKEGSGWGGGRKRSGAGASYFFDLSSEQQIQGRKLLSVF